MQTSITSWLNNSNKTAERPVEIQEQPDNSQNVHQNEIPRGSARSQPISHQTLSAQEPAGNDNPKLSAILSVLNSTSSAVSRLPSEVVISPISPGVIPAYRRLNSLLLPIPYADKFYDETLSDEVIASLTFGAMWADPMGSSEGPRREGHADRLVAAIRCRIIVPSSSSTDSHIRPQLYIATLGTLAPYRSHGIAQALLELATYRAIQNHNIECVTAHVWTAHEEAMEWYTKRGFEEVRRIEGYYKRLKPQDAVFIARPVGPLDMGVTAAFGSHKH